VADELAQRISAQTGIAVAPIGTPEAPTPSAPDPSGPLQPQAKDDASPALSLDKPAPLIKGRKIALLAGDGVDADQLQDVNSALLAEGCVVELIAAYSASSLIPKASAKGQSRCAERPFGNL
jgi:catalase